jgi:ppGpp synthetase/RelA/SpoT-type nucleotidyltranferase
MSGSRPENDPDHVLAPAEEREAPAPAGAAAPRDIPTFEEYLEWAEHNLECKLLDKATERSYEQNSNLAYATVEGHPFVAELPRFLGACEEQYNSLYGVGLFMSPVREIKLDRKSYSSVVNKSYRVNVLENERFPDSPEDGWITPSNWYERLTDIVRTRLVCKLIDGPKYLAERLKQRAADHELRSSHKTHQRDAGYYAYHFYVLITVPLLINERGETRTPDVDLSVEIQLTTQLQEVLYDLTHPIYERLRIADQPDSAAWKWDYGSPRFMAAYMGHTLHMLEAIILDLRDKGRTRT